LSRSGRAFTRLAVVALSLVIPVAVYGHGHGGGGGGGHGVGGHMGGGHMGGGSFHGGGYSHGGGGFYHGGGYSGGAMSSARSHSFSPAISGARMPSGNGHTLPSVNSAHGLSGAANGGAHSAFRVP